MKHDCGHDCKCNMEMAYMEAYKMACERLSGRDAGEVSLNAKAEFSAETGTYTVKYFDRECRIKCTEGETVFESFPAELGVTEKILVLHYLINARPAPLAGRLISLKEIQNGGAIYYPAFKKRAIDPLVKVFSNDTEGLIDAAKRIGGAREALGDAGATINVFPLVPVTYAVWKGDGEVSASGNVLFDASVSEFLPVEDIVVAASYGTYRLIGERKGKAGPAP